MVRFGVPELLIILAVVVLLFGVGRIGKVAGELGNGIRAFKKGLEGDSPETNKEEVQKN
jgi:sec-independent protein translocase protein TatA